MKYIASIIYVAVVILGIIGWVMCVVKFINTDFESPYKAEVIYAVGTFTGAGAIIGWIDIKD